ncbi:MAG: hypothetical protein KDA60_06730 [Planctomycetales bacterium]|nr:hypothetical protein [Planctomycetales bacterium]
MRPWYEWIVRWVVDYYLLATPLLLAVTLVGPLVRQPIRRIALAWSAIVSLVVLGCLLAVPEWSHVQIADWRTTVAWDSPSTTTLPRPPQSKGTASLNRVEGRDTTLLPQLGELATRRETTVPPGVARTKASTGRAYSEWAFVAYMAGTSIVIVRLASGMWTARRYVRASIPAPADLVAVLRQLLSREERPPELRLSRDIQAGVAMGLFRPTILLSQEYAKSKSESLSSVILHELAHLRHRDLWFVGLSPHRIDTALGTSLVLVGSTTGSL